MISITFDDGNESCYSEALPIMKESGVRGSFYITTEEIGTPDKMTMKEIESLHGEGHEIGSHTHTHPLLTTLSDDKLDFELRKSREILDSFNPRTFAYPCGNYDERVISAVSKYYDAARCYHEETGAGVNMLPVKGKDAHVLKDAPLCDHEKISADQEEPTWIIFTFHLYGRLSMKRIMWGMANGRLKLSTVKAMFMGSAKKPEHNISEIEFLRLICERAEGEGMEVLPVCEVLDKYCKLGS